MHYTSFVRLSAVDTPIQEYIRELAICATVGGPQLQHDLTSPAGRRLTSLIAELSDLCGTKATADVEAYRAFSAAPVLPVAQAAQEPADGLPAEPDWLEVAVRFLSVMLCKA